MVRKMLKDSFGFWLKQTGVDAVRIDTAKDVEKEFYEDFLQAEYVN
jgi:glycosidase